MRKSLFRTYIIYAPSQQEALALLLAIPSARSILFSHFPLNALRHLYSFRIRSFHLDFTNVKDFKGAAAVNVPS